MNVRILVMIISVMLLLSCRNSRELEQQVLAEHAVAEQSLEELQLPVVQTLLSLDESLNDFLLIVEGKKESQEFEDLNKSILEVQNKMAELSENLENQSRIISKMRVESIEPLITDEGILQNQ